MAEAPPTIDPNATRDPLATKSSGRSSSGSSSGRLEVRCPSCHSPMDVEVDTTLTDLTCSSCGSHFSLVDQSKATMMAPPLSKLGRFELIERLGVGGFGSVWKARDKELDRAVAIKIPRAAGMRADEQEKFFREARAAAQLRHPSIVSVHEVGRDGDNVYIVSDFVRGVTLDDWLTSHKLSSREAVSLCAAIADALQHAHEHGVVHRDLKPANIMLDVQGRPHLMDFGLARREMGEVTMTVDGQVLGTPAYMSPEQAQGEAHSADRRSDIYSLGVVLFQLLTSELPFRGNIRMLMQQVIHDEPPSPRKLNSSIPKDLETITLKCLEKSPARRYQTAHELWDDLQRFLRKEPIVARPVRKWERAAKWIYRHPAPAALLVTVGVALLASIAWLVMYSQSLELERQTLAKTVELEKAQRDADIAQAQSQKAVDFVIATFESADPIHFEGSSLNDARDDPKSGVEAILSRGRKYAEDLKNDMDAASRARIFSSIGSAYVGIGKIKEAHDCLNEALKIRRELDGNALSREFVAMLHNLARLNFFCGRYGEAEQQWRTVLAFYNDSSLEDRVDKRVVLTTKFWLAATLSETQRGPEIQHLLEEVVAARSPDLKDLDRDFALANLGLALVAARRSDFDQVMRYFLTGKQILQESGDENVDALDDFVRSVVHTVVGDNKKAAVTAELALAKSIPILGEAHPISYVLRLKYANALQRNGNPERAAGEIQSLLAIARKSFGAQPRTTDALYHLGDVLRDLNKPTDAVAQYLAAEEILVECEQMDQYDAAEVNYRLGMMDLVARRRENALKRFQETLRYENKLREGMRHPVVALGHIGLALANIEDAARSRSELKRAAKYIQKLPGDTTDIAVQLASFGDTFRQAGLDDMAEVLYREALRIEPPQNEEQDGGIVDYLPGPLKDLAKRTDGYSVGRACAGLGAVLLAKGQTAEAREYLKIADNIYTEQIGANDPRTAKVKSLLARASM